MPSFCAPQLVFPHLFTLGCRELWELSPHSFTLVCKERWSSLPSVQLALIYIRLLLPKSSKSEDLINLAKNSISKDLTYLARPITLIWECPENLAHDERLAKEAIKTYLARNRITWSTEAGDHISPPLSAQHHNPSITELPKEPATRKKKHVSFQLP
jgi:hypothetical protein